ncbi:MAG: MoxR family ATPase [Planctomycetota bacterium]|nr:MoxR family ATPase [Planctomycetota bacterium]
MRTRRTVGMEGELEELVEVPDEEPAGAATPGPVHPPAHPPRPPDPSIAKAAELAGRVQEETARVLVGLEAEILSALTGILAGGHVLLEGPPGVAKTLLVRTLAQTLGASFGRVQFTPDLMPADVTGTSVFHPGEGVFHFRPGPIFVQFLLCDEINRAPAKTQSALLEAMQERTVTIDGQAHELPQPFVVFATMNPIEHEGTYPLPEAQLDRFLFKLLIGYPDPDVEARLLAEAHTRPPSATPAELGVRPVTTPAELMEAAGAVDLVAVREDLPGYVVKLCGETRKTPSLVLGASPRAGVMILRAAKACAALHGRDFVTPDDVKHVFLPALRHRVVLDPAEEIEGVQADQILTRILDSVEVPR